MQQNLKQQHVLIHQDLLKRQIYFSAIGKLDIGSLKTVLTDLSKLSDLVDNGVVKKTVYDEFFT